MARPPLLMRQISIFIIAWWHTRRVVLPAMRHLMPQRRMMWVNVRVSRQLIGLSRAWCPTATQCSRLKSEERSGDLIKLPIVQEHPQRSRQAKDRHGRLREDGFG